MAYPLYVAFLWHMHQPYYQDSLTGRRRLPWVRLHATKDYVHMAEVLRQYPAIRATFNFVPSLLEQLQEYAEGALDDWALVSLKDDLTADDKRFLLDSFFSISWDRVIRRYPRYWRLLQVRQHLDGALDLLSDTYWRDLIVWFNLAWIDPAIIARDPDLQALVEKGAGFSREDIRLVLRKHQELCGQVIPLYRALAAQGQIELTTSPYFHPILPLIIDTRSARVASPRLTLPNLLFAHPEDAEEQIRLALRLHEEVFGAPPQGLWPPEGAVSPEAAHLIARRGLRWIATDEGILARTLGITLERDGYEQLRDPRPLYQPYTLAGTNLAIVFRDRVLSDRIGFVYQHMDGAAAADDLVGRLCSMADLLKDDPQPYLVTIALDGENCWEHYTNNGNDFLHALYRRLSEEPRLKTTTISAYLRRFPPRATLPSLFTGSWIFANLETWIGEPEQNRAWELLALTRGRLVAWQQQDPLVDVPTLALAWREIYIAEGSDWFWWYYSHNKFGQEHLFDAEFRAHLANVYRIMGLPVPVWLTRPIAGALVEVRARPATAYISPRLVAELPTPLDWTGAGYLEPETAAGAMQRGRTIASRLYYGHNPATLFFRLEAAEDLAGYGVALYLGREDGHGLSQFRERLAHPGLAPDCDFLWSVEVPASADRVNLWQAAEDQHWVLVESLDSLARKGTVLEAAAPLAALGLKLGDTLNCVWVIVREGVVQETLPTVGHLRWPLTPFG